MKGEIKEYKTTDGNLVYMDEEGRVISRKRVIHNEDGSTSYIEDPDMSYQLVENPFKGQRPKPVDETETVFFMHFAIFCFILGVILFFAGMRFFPYLLFSGALLFLSVYIGNKAELKKDERLQNIGTIVFVVTFLYFVASGIHYFLFEWNIF